jgi:hypothetical protein
MHCTNRSSGRWIRVALVLSGALFLPAGRAHAQCAETTFQNYTGAGQVVCPCFIAGEQAGAVFTLPAAAYPVEILKVGIGWGSQFGGSPQQIEGAIHVYAGGLPDPGTPIFSLPGPVLTDGVINEYNLGPLPGEIIIPSGPFTVTLEFALDSDIFAPSVVHDANGCQGGKNVVFAMPGGWQNACALGVTGDWVFYVKYRSLNVTASASPAQVTFSNVPAFQTTCNAVNINNTGCDTLIIDGISGCGSAPFSVDTTATAHLVPPGGSTSLEVCVTPTSNDPADCSVLVYSNASNSPATIDVDLDGVTAAGAPARGDYAITGVVPNPFNPQTSVRFVLPRAAAVTAEVWSVDGRRVATLLRGQSLPAGANEVRWDGRNTSGERVASGMYFFRMTSALGARTARLVLLE